MFDHNLLVDEVPRLKRFALHLTRSEFEADDLLQATLLRAMEKDHLFQDDSNLPKWLSKMMYNLFVTDYRRKSRFETRFDPQAIIDNLFCKASQEYWAELVNVARCMEELSEEHREVLYMVCIQGMHYQDVAETLGIPLGTVRSRLSRARRQLEEQLLAAESVNSD